ncbi:MAG: MBL fold metallo-hydrolase [Acidobacteriota bacterium]
MRISSRCHAVLGLAYLPPWSVNAGIVTGEEVTLIVDTGANALAASTIHGYATALRPGNRMMVINAEKHFDHIGGNSFFHDLGIDVYGHSEIERTEAEFAAEMADFKAAIMDPARQASGEESAFYHATRLANPNKSIRDDTGFELGNCSVDVLLTPGHTDTNISVYVPADGVLYCGDALTSVYLPNLDTGSVKVGWRQWLASLDRIARLAPKAIVPGHGPAMIGEDVGRGIERMRRILEEAIDG